MKIESIEKVKCCVCGKLFTRPAFHVAKSSMPVCAGCTQPKSSSGGYEPMIQVEVGEYQRLLKLYYAAFERAHADDGKTEVAFGAALDQCNRYFEGGTYAGSCM